MQNQKRTGISIADTLGNPEMGGIKDKLRALRLEMQEMNQQLKVFRESAAGGDSSEPSSEE